MRKPRPYQPAAIKHLRSLKCALVFIPLRGGKTKIVIDALRRGNELPRMLVICPLTVVSVWQNELAAEGITNPIVLIRGTRKQKRELMKTEGSVIFLTNYETISALRSHASLYLTDCTVVVLDESTKIKHSYTLVAKAVTGALRRIPRRFVLTGTPTPESLLDLWQPVDFVKPGLFDSSFFVWRETHFTPNFWGTKWAPNPNTREELFKKIASITVVVDEKELKLSPQNDIPIPLELTPEMREAYDKLQHSFATAPDIAKHLWESNYIVAIMEKLSQICSGFLSFGSHTRCKTRRTQPIEADIDAVLLRATPPELQASIQRFIDAPKEIWLARFLKIRPQPIVVWFRHWLASKTIEKVFEMLGRSCGMINGATASHARKALLADFAQGRISALAAQIDTAKFGISLAVAKHVVFYEPTWSFEAYYQARGRSQVADDPVPVNYYLLSCANTIEELIYTTQANKQNLHTRFRETLLSEKPHE